MSVLKSASEIVDKGIAVFPVRFRDKRPAVKTWEVYKTHLPSLALLRQWFPCDARNYAIVLGWQNLAVLDFDDMDAWYSWNAWALDNCNLLDDEYRVKTNRGVHMYFHLIEEVHNLKLPGIDFKSNGYTVGPGSTHPSGHIYRALNDFHLPVIVSLSDILPAELLQNAVSADVRPVYPIDDVMPLETADNGIYDIYDIAASVQLDTRTPLEQVKESWRIERFFSNHPLVFAGDFAPVPCPFHEDAHASAWINKRLQLFGCSSCNMRPMSPIGLYAALHQVDITQAVREML